MITSKIHFFFRKLYLLCKGLKTLAKKDRSQSWKNMQAEALRPVLKTACPMSSFQRWDVGVEFPSFISNISIKEKLFKLVVSFTEIVHFFFYIFTCIVHVDKDGNPEPLPCGFKPGSSSIHGEYFAYQVLMGIFIKGHLTNEYLLKVCYNCVLSNLLSTGRIFFFS